MIRFLHSSLKAVVDDDYEGDGIPLTDTTRTIVIIVHYLGIVFTTFAVYAIMTNITILQRRIYSPTLLMIAITWLLMATSFEIGNHFYVDNWQLYDPRSDLINGSFSFFNFGAQNLLAISLRKKGRKFFSCNDNDNENTINGGNCNCNCIINWFVTIGDPILAVLVIINPIVYAVFGRSTSVMALSPLAFISGLFTLFRVWYNLGPNVVTMLGGIVFFALTILGVIFLAVYNATDIEWIHALLGGSFITSVIPLSIAFLYAQDTTNTSTSEVSEQEVACPKIKENKENEDEDVECDFN